MRDKESDIPAALYQSALGQMVMDYVGRIHPAVLQSAMESRAVQTLEAIRCILENDKFSDPECFERIDSLVMLFFKELDVKINRHNELD